MARARLALLVPLALLLPAACSDDDGGSDAASAPGSEAEADETTSTTARATTSTTGDGTTSSTAAGRPTSTTTPSGPGIRLTGGSGSGTFAYEVFPERSELCYRMAVEGIGGSTGGGIVRGTGGDPVVTLITPESGDEINTCVASDGVTLDEIRAAPGDFTVVVVGADGRLSAPLT